MFPNLVFYNGAIWQMGYSNYFGQGYRKLTSTLRKHPKHIFISQMQMLATLKQDKAQVAIDPKPTDQIIDTKTYSEWINSKPS